MKARSPRPVLVLALLVLAVVSIGRRSEASGQTAGRADFSGTWALKDEVSDDPVRDTAKDGKASSGGERRQGGGQAGGRSGGRGRAGSAGGWGGSALGDLPLEALVDARLLVITDDGSTVRVTYSSGRKRVLHPDGDERELDDGDGPAKVTTRRKGETGEKIVVSSKWSSERGLTETWELLGNPRRLTFTGKVSGRHSYPYQRVYVPAPAQPSAAPIPPATVPATRLTPAAADVTPIATGAPAGMAECSIRPPKGTSRADLARMAKVTEADAAKRATASVAPLRVSSVISSDVEVEGGCLVWPFDLRLPDKGGVQEVLVDAGDGKILSSRFEASNEP